MFTNEQKSSNPSYIILPVHNRREITLRCLEHLEKQGDLNAYHIVVVDDGSTDGTAQEILQQYPMVNLLKGDGNLWWTGAIKLGMKYVVSKGARYCVWLNDDTLPNAGAIQSLVDYCDNHPKTIAGANILDPETNKPSYGGVILDGLKIRPVFSDDTLSVTCDGLNGNLVCFPTELIKVIGYPENESYPHYHGDTIYTHCAQSAGYQLVILKDSIAYCKNDHKPISWIRSNQTISQILKERTNIKSPHYWKAHLAYYTSFLGLIGIVLYIYEIWLKMFLLIAIGEIFRLPQKFNMKHRV